MQPIMTIISKPIFFKFFCYYFMILCIKRFFQLKKEANSVDKIWESYFLIQFNKTSMVQGFFWIQIWIL